MDVQHAGECTCSGVSFQYVLRILMNIAVLAGYTLAALSRMMLSVFREPTESGSDSLQLSGNSGYDLAKISDRKRGGQRTGAPKTDAMGRDRQSVCGNCRCNSAGPLPRNLPIGHAHEGASAQDGVWRMVRLRGRAATSGAARQERQILNAVERSCEVPGAALQAAGCVLIWGENTTQSGYMK